MTHSTALPCYVGTGNTKAFALHKGGRCYACPGLAETNVLQAINHMSQTPQILSHRMDKFFLCQALSSDIQTGQQLTQ